MEQRAPAQARLQVERACQRQSPWRGRFFSAFMWATSLERTAAGGLLRRKIMCKAEVVCTFSRTDLNAGRARAHVRIQSTREPRCTRMKHHRSSERPGRRAPLAPLASRCGSGELASVCDSATGLAGGRRWRPFGNCSAAAASDGTLLFSLFSFLHFLYSTIYRENINGTTTYVPNLESFWGAQVYTSGSSSLHFGELKSTLWGGQVCTLGSSSLHLGDVNASLQSTKIYTVDGAEPHGLLD
jgi:hypothetical protein